MFRLRVRISKEYGSPVDDSDMWALAGSYSRGRLALKFLADQVHGDRTLSQIRNVFLESVLYTVKNSTLARQIIKKAFP